MQTGKTETAALTRRSLIILGSGVIFIALLSVLFLRPGTDPSQEDAEFSPSFSFLQEDDDSVTSDKLINAEPIIPPPTRKKIVNKKEDVVLPEIEIADPVFEDSPTTISANAKPEDEIYSFVDENAAPVEGMPDFYRTIKRKMKYPIQATRELIEGRVFVEFVVEKDGTLREVKSVKGIGGGCDEEAVRLVSASPAWIPAKLNGQVVRQKMMVHIKFELDRKAKRDN